MNKKLLALLVILGMSSAMIAQTIIPSRYQFFQGDTLNGFDFNAAFNSMGAYSVKANLSETEKNIYMFRQEKAFMQNKYRLPVSVYQIPYNGVAPSGFKRIKIQGRSIAIPTQAAPKKNITQTQRSTPPPPAPLASSCQNLDWEQGDMSNWSGSMGWDDYDGTYQTLYYYGLAPLTGAPGGGQNPFVGGPNAAFGTSCVGVTLVSAGTDPYSNLPMKMPGGGAFSARIGDKTVNIGAGFAGSCDYSNQVPTNGGGCPGCPPSWSTSESAGEILMLPYTVTAANCLLTYNYNILLNDNSHPAGEQPFFFADIVSAADTLTEVVACSGYFQEATTGVPPSGYGTSASTAGGAPVFFSKWSGNTVDLSPVIGSQVILMFYMAGCVPGGHFGYAYVDGSCGPLQFANVGAPVCAGSNQTISAPTLPSGTTYSWSGPGIVGSNTTATIVVNTPGTYSLTYSLPAPNAGCPITISAVVVFNAPPSLTPTSANPVCNGGTTGSASVVASGGVGPYTYSWSNGAGNVSSIAGVGAGSYTATVTTSQGCSANHVFTITTPSAVTGSATQTATSCNGGSNGTATANPSGGTAGYTYLWNSAPTQSTQTATNLPAGAYVCTITDSKGCTGTANITVNQPTPVSATNVETDATCNGGSNGIATANPSGGTAGYTYLWNSAPTQSTQTASNLPAGTYICTITDSKGCTTTTSATINQPTPLTLSVAGSAPSACTSSTGTASVTPGGGTPGYTYVWNPAPGAGQGTVSVSGLAPGVYNCTIHDSKGCTQTTSVTINTAGGPTSTLSAPSNPLCNGVCNGSATVNASGGTGTLTYNWSPAPGAGQGTATASSLCAGTYNCTITDANGCTTTQSATITQPAAITATPSSGNASCGLSNGSASVSPAGGGTGGLVYNWTGGTITSGQGTASVTGLAAGTYICTITDGNGCADPVNVSVNNTGGPTASSTATNITCNAACTGSATVTASGGTAPLTYNWSPAPGAGQGTATASALCAGTYICTITDATGCLVTQSDTIRQPAALAIAPTSSNVKCNAACNGTATATASGGTGVYTYAWTNGGGSAQTASSLCPNTYVCTVTDANGCSTTQNFTITQPNVLNAAPTQTNVTCNGNGNGSADVNVSGGTAAYTYVWSGGTIGAGQGTASATGLAPGVYNCQVTDVNGCTTSQTFTITQPALLAVTPSQANPSCGGMTNGTATVNVTGGTPTYSYNWTPPPTGGQGTAFATGLSSGTFNCTVSDSNHCTISQSFTITQPTPLSVAPSQTNESCNGNANGTATVNATGGTGLIYTYSWVPAPGGGQGTSIATGLPPATYVCTVTDSMGCFTSQSITITQPAPLAITPAQTNISCNGGTNGTATATTSGGTVTYTYVWTPVPVGGQGTATATGLSPGPESCTVTDANGCSTTQNFTITQPTVLAATATDSSTSCNMPNGSAFANPSGGTGAYTYNWSPAPGGGQGTSNATGLSAGTYICTITDANGCTAIASAAIAPSVNTTNAYFNATANTGASPLPVTFTDSSTINPISWVWNFGDGGTGSGQTVTHTYSAIGTFTVTETVTNADGCVNIYKRTVEVHELPSFLYIPNVFTPNDDGENDNWQVRYQGISQFDARIYDRWGVMMTELFAPDQGWDGHTSGGLKAVPGTYYYILTAKGDDGKKYDSTGFLMLIRH